MSITITYSFIKYLNSRTTYYTSTSLYNTLSPLGTFSYLTYEWKGSLKEGMIAYLTKTFQTKDDALTWRKQIDQLLTKIPTRGKIAYQIKIIHH